MTRRRAIVAVGAAALALAVLISWPRTRGAHRASPTLVPGRIEAAVGAPGKAAAAPPRATTEVSELPAGDPVPIADLEDDPNRVPGAPLEVTGTVFRSGRPVAGALVRLCRAYPFSDRLCEPTPTPLAEALSSDDGKFALTTPRRARLVVEVRAEGSALRRLLVYVPLAGQPEPLRVDLGAGRTLSVRVIEPNGSGVSGVAVRVSCGGGAVPALETFPCDARYGNDELAFRRGTAPSLVLESLTDGTGRTRFEGIEPGVVAVEAAHVRDFVVVPTGAEIVFVREEPGCVEGVLQDEEGRAVPGVRLAVDTVGFRNRTGSATATTDADGRVRICDVPPGWIIAGRVEGRGPVDGPAVRVGPGATARWNAVLARLPEVRGRVLRPDGAPCAGARVILRVNWDNYATTPLDVVDAGWSEDDGSFALKVPETGGYTIEATAHGLVASCEVAAPATGVEVALVPCARVVGVVRGLHEADSRLSCVTLWAKGFEPVETQVDATGSFAFEHVPPLKDAQLNGVAKSGVFDVPAGAVVHVDLAVDPTCRITGFVRDEEGRPVAGAVVQAPFNRPAGRDMSLLQPASLRTTETDDDGRYELVVRVQKPPCHWTQVTAAHADYAPSECPEFRPPDAGGTARVDLTLRPGAALRGRVIDGAGGPVRHAAITADPGRGIYDHPARLRASTYTDAEGRFAFPHLVPGAYEILLQADDIVGRRVDAEAGGPEVVIALEHAGTIAGIVVDARGRPHAEFGLDVGCQGCWTFVGPGGRFRLSGLPPGLHDISADRIEGEGTRQSGVPTGTEDLILRLPPE